VYRRIAAFLAGDLTPSSLPQHSPLINADKLSCRGVVHTHVAKQLPHTKDHLREPF
jgi:hypothetical protein